MRIIYTASLLSMTFLAFLFGSSRKKHAPQPDIVAIGALRNPDRGYHLESGYFAQNLTNPFNTTEVYPNGFIEAREKKYQCEKDSVTLTQLYIYLSQWVGQDIPPQGLDNIQRLFDGLRDRGYKAILRFAYNYTGLNSTGGESKYWILRHIEQLKPLLRKNIGQIAVVQAGFIGAWGEWHTSPLQKDQEAKNAIVTALLDALPPACFVEMRHPGLKNALTLPEGNYRSRIGFNNDYFTAGQHSHAPGNDFVPGDAWYLQVKRESSNEYISGEIPYNEKSEWGLSSLISTDATLQILRDHHYSAFDITQNAELNIASWKTVGVYPALLDSLHILFAEGYFRDAQGRTVARSFYDFVRDHLGYRLDLLDGSVVKAGSGSLIYDLKLINTGFATVIDPRMAYLVLINEHNEVVKEVPLDADPKSWQPYDTADQTYRPLIHEIRGRIPVELSGRYKIGLWMPEPGNNKYDGRYDIRLAEGRMVKHWVDPKGRRVVNIITDTFF